MVFHFAQIDQGFDDGAIGPNIGAAQIIDAQDLNVLKGHKLRVGDAECFSECVANGAESPNHGRYNEKNTMLRATSSSSCFLFTDLRLLPNDLGRKLYKNECVSFGLCQLYVAF